jgi:RNA polymerase sigma-70 factor (ECF subfamily)
VSTLEPADGSVGELVEHLFRHESGRLVAALVRRLGAEHFDLAEDAVQDALVQALRRWPFHGIPPAPGAWLLAAARHRAIDRLRRARRGAEAERLAGLDWAEHAAPDATHDSLALLLLCGHPALPAESAIALTLHSVGGFSAGEIARGLLLSETTVAQRLVRVKRQLRGMSAKLDDGTRAGTLAERHDRVLAVLHQLFTQGHAAASGDGVVRTDICREALRLVRLVTDHPEGDTPAAHALAALIALQSARVPSRADAEGDVVLLPDQDRCRWDRGLMALGFRHLERAARGPALTRYHLEAQVAALHTAAPSFEATDWPAILAAYDRLQSVSPGGITTLNRAVAVAMVHGPAAALEALAPSRADPALANYPWLHAVTGWLREREGELRAAATDYAAAAALSRNQAQQRLLLRLAKSLDERSNAATPPAAG